MSTFKKFGNLFKGGKGQLVTKDMYEALLKDLENINTSKWVKYRITYEDFKKSNPYLFVVPSGNIVFRAVINVTEKFSVPGEDIIELRSSTPNLIIDKFAVSGDAGPEIVYSRIGVSQSWEEDYLSLTGYSTGVQLDFNLGSSAADLTTGAVEIYFEFCKII